VTPGGDKIQALKDKHAKAKKDLEAKQSQDRKDLREAQKKRRSGVTDPEALKALDAKDAKEMKNLMAKQKKDRDALDEKQAGEMAALDGSGGNRSDPSGNTSGPSVPGTTGSTDTAEVPLISAAATEDSEDANSQDLKAIAKGFGPSNLLWLLLLIPILAVLGSGRVHLPMPIGIPHMSASPPTQPIVAANPARPVSPAPNWVIPSGPSQININAPGLTSLGSDPVVLPVADVLPPIVQPIVVTQAEEPFIVINGPDDPDRLLAILLAMMVAALPLMLDALRGFPLASYKAPNYLSPFLHYIIIGMTLVFLLLLADQQFRWSARYGPIVSAGVYSIHHNLIVPVAVNVPVENLIPAVEDMFFGEGRDLIAACLAGLGVVLLSQRKPLVSAPDAEYMSGLGQAMACVSAAILGTIVWNA
jgi:hypothetical protein